MLDREKIKAEFREYLNEAKEKLNIAIVWEISDKIRSGTIDFSKYDDKIVDLYLKSLKKDLSAYPERFPRKGTKEEIATAALKIYDKYTN